MLLAHTCSDLYAFLALSAVPKTSPAHWIAMLDELGISASDLVARRWPAHKSVNTDKLEGLLKHIDHRRIDAALGWQQLSSGHQLVCYSDPRYPKMLRHLNSPPLVLFVNGNSEHLSLPGIAIVGSRRASVNGRSLARMISAQLSERGLSVVSGLAAGIDAAAHEGALATNGTTVAVVGTGPDLVYPHRNKALHHKIIEHNGAIISEFWPGTAPRARHFPQRNRIIAAMTLGTLVIEATIKSGTLITANMAANIGRDVFAIPGNIDNPLTAGCHHLLKQGAILVTEVADIMNELQLPQQNLLSVEGVGKPDEQKTHEESLATDKILASVNQDVTSVDIICERSNTPVSQVLATLLQYELRGLVAAVPGGYIKLRGK